MIPQKLLLTLTTLGALALGSGARAADSAASVGPWSARLRATYLATIDHSSGVGGKDGISVDDKWIPEIDVDYRFNSTWSAELVLTIPQEQTVNIKGTGEIGTFYHLPPTLLVQYHPQVCDWFQPYVGAGVNITLIFDDHLLNDTAKLDSFSVGPAAQVGFDVKLADRWTLNFDLKRIMIRSDVRVGGADVAEVHLDPWLYSVGVGYAF